MKRATILAVPVRTLSIYSIFYLFYLFRRNSPMKCALQPKIAKKHQNTLF